MIITKWFQLLEFNFSGGGGKTVLKIMKMLYFQNKM